MQKIKNKISIRPLPSPFKGNEGGILPKPLLGGYGSQLSLLDKIGKNYGIGQQKGKNIPPLNIALLLKKLLGG